MLVDFIDNYKIIYHNKDDILKIYFNQETKEFLEIFFIENFHPNNLKKNNISVNNFKKILTFIS